MTAVARITRLAYIIKSPEFKLGQDPILLVFQINPIKLIQISGSNDMVY